MHLYLSKNGFYFSGKVSELRQFVRLHTKPSVTLQDYINCALH